MTIPDKQLWTTAITDAPLPPLANMQEVHNPTNPFLELYQTLGPIYRIPRPDNSPLVVLAGPEANVFTGRYGTDFFVSAELWKDFNSAMGAVADGMMTNRDGEANRKRRVSASRDYSRAKVLDQLPRMIELTQAYAQWQVGESIEVLPAMQRIVAEQLGQLLVNYSVGEYLEDFVLYLATSIASSFGDQDRAALSSARFLRAKQRVFELGHLIVAAHRNVPLQDRKPDLVDEALARAAEQPELYTEERLAFVGLGPLLAGLETVARTNSFLLYALLKHPEALKRVQDEADQLFAQGPLTWETLKSMSALQGAAMETLRMYTSAGGFSGIVARPFTFAKHRLEVGNEVYVAIAVSHFLPELFPQPDTFDLDRYREPRNEHRQRGAYAPFGLGDHTCLGAGIAEIQLMVITATLLHRYQFALDPPEYQLNPDQDLTIGSDAAEQPRGPRFRLKIAAQRS